MITARWSFLLVLLCGAVASAQGVLSTEFASPVGQLRLEILSDRILHFEYSFHPQKGKIPTSPLIAAASFPGASDARKDGASLRTAGFSVQIDEKSLCFTYSSRNTMLTQVCPRHLSQDWKGLTLSAENTKNLYGLGQQFRNPGNTDGDWLGTVRFPGEINGNYMGPFNGGNTGNTQIPILYAVGPQHAEYALFLDSVYKQQWNFRYSPWIVETWGDQVRGFLIAGDSLPSLRKQYLALVGKPLVPPKKAFGLWVSEYGYKNWAEMEAKLKTLREKNFPLDGFVLDLYWFGGITGDSDNSAMGRLAWDTKHFPDARNKLRTLRDKEGLGIIPIEESYVARNLPEHADLAQRGFLVKDASGKAPAYLTYNPWWGKGGMIDWTNPAANDYRHRSKRLSLIEDGVVGLWTDLGEPELYPSDGLYAGGRQADVHNLYNFHWLEGIHAAYAKYTPKVRPFLLSRSGNAGIQRFGAGMWSGDIGSDLTSLASHLNAQMHVSLSGIDYYGSDIGGFKREALTSDLHEAYTQWFATGSLFDVPVRPHTENLCNCKETAPDRVGDVASNLFNIRQRYELIPYLYSLAHTAHREGEPVFPPLVYAFENDLETRQLGSEKMIGPWLLARGVAKAGAKTVDVYLPKARWFDFHDDHAVASGWYRAVPLYRKGLLVPPVYAKAGAIIPMAYVDSLTMNALGKRSDGSRADALRVRIYPDATASVFDLFEDDGETTGYARGEVRKTRIGQVLQSSKAVVTVERAQGTYPGALRERDTVLELVGLGDVSRVSLGGVDLPKSALAVTSETGWWREGGRLFIRTGVLPVSQPKRLELTLTP